MDLMRKIRRHNVDRVDKDDLINIPDHSEECDILALVERKLKLVKSVCWAATPAPWEPDYGSLKKESYCELNFPGGDPEMSYCSWEGAIRIHGCIEQKKKGDTIARNNTEFISLARTMMPRLHDAVLLSIRALDRLERKGVDVKSIKSDILATLTNES